MGRFIKNNTCEIKIHFKEIGAEKVDWILVTWDRY
jgi:hypothetical protein